MPIQIPKTTGFFESFDGTPIYYEVRGEGKPLFLVYGIVCLMNHWQHQIKNFSQNYQVITLDLRGHHSTPIPKNRDYLNLESIAQDIVCLAEHLNIKEASFWGHSFGTQLLIKAYELKPELFSNLVLINGFASNPLNGMFGTDVVNTVFDFAKQTYGVLPETFSFLWKKMATNPIGMRLSALAGGFNLNLTSFKDIEIYAKGVASIETDVFLTLFEKMMKYDGTPVLEKINCPSLIITGEKDSVTPREFQEIMYKKIKGSEFFIVPHGTHCSQLDMPDYVNMKIQKFLEKNNY